MQRSRSDIAEPPRVTERAQLRDVAPEEKRHRPVGDDPELPGQQRQLVEVIGAGDEPAEEAAQAQAENVCDSLVAAERGDLAEHAVAVRLRLAAEVLR